MTLIPNLFKSTITREIMTIKASMVIEMLGRPKEHLDEGMKALISRLENEKGARVIEKKFNEAIPIEKTSDLFTTFSEIEIEFKSVMDYFGIIFAYMPSHIEIIHPEKFSMSNADLNELGNALVQRIHNYDAVTKNMIAERNFVLEKLKEIDSDFYKKITTPPINNETKNPNQKNTNKKK